ncbi:MAG: response regulator [Thermodesulfobacteriota bacterium]|nr:response regulator [Thermodesulfobacteriota bacterium]
MIKCIMTVDDSPTIRSSISFCLKNAGYDVINAVDGQDATEKLKQIRVEGRSLSLIITDINMPQMDGITFIKNVKKSDFRFIPIIVLTTEGDIEMIEKGKDAGAAGWLVKPFQPEQLLWAVKRLIWLK